jgi:hypothetical protein
VEAGLGSRRGRTPPPLYAWDPDTGRLAVTTPHYSTAIISSNQEAFPYGGIDIARLFDGRQEVAGNIGGVPPAAFGMVVRDPAGRTLLATQRPEYGGHRGAPVVKLVRAPSGVGASPRARPTRPFAGSFWRIKTAGTARRGAVSGRAEYTFTSRTIDARWSFRATGRARRRSVELRFPSWRGDGRAHVWAVAPGGSAREMLDTPALSGARWFYVQSTKSGYAVVPRKPWTARARLTQPAAQPSAPRPGPTLVVELAHLTRKKALGASVRLIPAPDLDTAKRLVAKLG